MSEFDLEYEAQRSLERLRPQLDQLIEAHYADQPEAESRRRALHARLDRHWRRFFGLLHRLYGHHYDFFYYLQRIVLTMGEAAMARPSELCHVDQRRENNPEWYESPRLVGGSLYVDLFAGDLQRLREKIPYFQELGLTYLHLMPLFLPRTGNSDGGYAISDYRTVDPKLGTMEDLRALADALRAVGINLCLDFVFNHTSDEHEWAIRAQEGEREYLDYYYTFRDRTQPNRYERHLREIFPTIRRGNFSWHEGMRRWVWTTFNSFQWDLRYANPEVFRAMAGEVLYLANTGVDILRLDAVAFIWKQMGTNCENLPEAHLLIQAFNALTRIVAPGLVFKSEAIVHPDEVRRYIGEDECQLSYNPTVMALLWESAATREVKLLRQSISHRQQLPPGTNWLNYLRGHDDIGWSFDNADAWKVGINPEGHRDFLNRFYTGRFPGAFALGVPFQHNEDTGDMRISGTMASLVGLEQALEEGHAQLRAMALRRQRMLYGVLASLGGIPLIFLGEELGLLNDYSYLSDPDKLDDSRWIHRPAMNWDAWDEVQQGGTYRAEVYEALRTIFALRQQQPALHGTQLQLLPTHPQVLGYLRQHEGNQLIVLASFTEAPTRYDLRPLRTWGIAHHLRDLFDERVYSTGATLELAPYALHWLVEA